MSYCLSAVLVTPKIYCENENSAIVVAESKSQLMTWWKSVKFTPPFNQFVVDRIEGISNKCRLRLCIEFRNKGIKIDQIFKDTFVTCENLNPANLVEYILNNLNRTYKIQGQSYQITRLISTRGCYGDVFLAHEQESKKNVVIKILRIEDDKEDQVLKKLKENGYHPNIVQYIGSDVVMGKTWIVMEYIDGIIFAKYDGDWTSDLEKQYRSALRFIRKAGVEIERENEMENIMITVSQTPLLKFIDFGTLARS